MPTASSSSPQICGIARFAALFLICSASILLPQPAVRGQTPAAPPVLFVETGVANLHGFGQLHLEGWAYTVGTAGGTLAHYWPLPAQPPQPFSGSFDIGYASFSRSFGASSSSGSYISRVTHAPTTSTFTFYTSVYIRGNPGTPYRVTRSWSANVTASISSGLPPVWAEALNATMGLTARVESVGSATQASDSNVEVREGVTAGAISYLGEVYSLATVFGVYQVTAVAGSNATGLAQAVFTDTITVDGLGEPADSDGDGVEDGLDRCPGTAAGAAVDTNGCSQAQVDSDGDGICNSSVSSSWCAGSDNCPLVANADQRDSGSRWDWRRLRRTLFYESPAQYPKSRLGPNSANECSVSGGSAGPRT